MKFKEGDRVRIKEGLTRLKHGSPVASMGGQKGIVTDYMNEEYNWTRVNFLSFLGSRCWVVDNDELELDEPGIPIHYKAFILTADGKRISIFAGSSPCYAGSILNYEEGCITYAPPKSKGLWVNDNLEEARSQISNKSHPGIFVVHEVIPFGDRFPDETVDLLRAPKSNRYPAVFVGKEVWREGQREDVVWEDITDKCRTELREYKGGVYVRISFEGRWIAGLYLGKGSDCPKNEDSLNLDLADDIYELRREDTLHDGTGTFRIFRRSK